MNELQETKFYLNRPNSFCYEKFLRDFYYETTMFDEEHSYVDPFQKSSTEILYYWKYRSFMGVRAEFFSEKIIVSILPFSSFGDYELAFYLLQSLQKFTESPILDSSGNEIKIKNYFTEKKIVKYVAHDILYIQRKNKRCCKIENLQGEFSSIKLTNDFNDIVQNLDKDAERISRFYDDATKHAFEKVDFDSSEKHNEAKIIKIESDLLLNKSFVNIAVLEKNCIAQNFDFALIDISQNSKILIKKEHLKFISPYNWKFINDDTLVIYEIYDETVYQNFLISLKNLDWYSKNDFLAKYSYIKDNFYETEKKARKKIYNPGENFSDIDLEKETVEEWLKKDEEEMSFEALKRLVMQKIDLWFPSFDKKEYRNAVYRELKDDYSFYGLAQEKYLDWLLDEKNRSYLKPVLENFIFWKVPCDKAKKFSIVYVYTFQTTDFFETYPKFFYPCVECDIKVHGKIIAIEQRDYNFVAKIKIKLESGETITFFDTDYFATRTKYKIENDYDFELSCIDLNAETFQESRITLEEAIKQLCEKETKPFEDRKPHIFVSGHLG